MWWCWSIPLVELRKRYFWSHQHLKVNNFRTAQGWKADQHPRFIADLTGDKRGDIIGFGDAGVYVSYNNKNGTFQPAKFVLSNLDVQQGWQVSKHPGFIVDSTGSGHADIIQFGDGQTCVTYNDGKGGLGSFIALTSEFSLSGGNELLTRLCASSPT